MYKNPIPVSVGIIPSTTPGELLLVERSDGGIALPGGYIDELEDVALALTREVWEETGLELDRGKWRLFFSTITPDNKLLLFACYAEPARLPKHFMPTTEVVRVLSAPWHTPLKFPLHEAAVRAWRCGPGWRVADGVPPAAEGCE
ncbi:MAG TPA: NUDIX domain-containing protein [Noviherbaspirillum sp.]|uniref:NUDIX domain-containing protein n=1 Tax=Noviherbaspirillum sp. TaxID=1926288 RepID=UPI002D701685|nr:NUDIX domain-containing protein [Noviherbaspirillum sp.]HYD95220.1 NUDIX domain-containing protein [Noviherbaspirillum sp.]